MSIAYKDALENCIISNVTYNILPKKCVCGCDLELDDKLEKLVCSNENCYMLVVNKIYSLSKKLDLGLSVNDIITIVDRLKLITPFQLFILDDAYKSKLITEDDIHDIQSIANKIKEFKYSEHYFYELLEICGIRRIENIAKQLAYGFSSVDEFYNEIESCKLSFINERLGIENSSICPLSNMIYDTILELQDELIFADSILNIKQFNNVLKVAIIDTPYGYLNRSEVIDFLNRKYKDITFLHVVTIDESLDILINETKLVNNKFREARLINDKFIAEQVNNGIISLDSIDNKINGKLKPIGSKIFIGNFEVIGSRIEEWYHER